MKESVSAYDPAYDPRYPIGRFAHDGPVSAADLAGWTRDIAALPDALRRAVAGLTEDALDAPYRPGGWTRRQVVHHVADSHLNAVLRFKWALTEDAPLIKPYFEERWAMLPDYTLDPAVSLALLEALHTRWAALLGTLPPEAFERTYIHPESGPMPLARAAGLYAWHGRHHLAHVAGPGAAVR